MSTKKYLLAKYGCYMQNICGAMVVAMSPLLFTTFMSLYDISYTQLGLLTLVNFVSQFLTDLTFSIVSKKHDIHKLVRLVPPISLLGFLIYALMPVLFAEQVYLWLIIGTVIFSIASGGGEVLLSPTIASIPTDNPQKEMSKLHATYAGGVVLIVIIASLLLKLFGRDNWYIVVLILLIFPLITTFMFIKAELPEEKRSEAIIDKKTGSNKLLLTIVLMLCIFFGACSEVTMTSWCSTYLETTFSMDKTYADIFGLALFAFALGLGRLLYSYFGKKIYPVLMIGFIGCTICYVVAGASYLPILGLIACVLTGLFSSMLWPGTIIVAEEKFIGCGITIFALLAAAGDFGCSFGPQMAGISIDLLESTSLVADLASKYSLTVEQVSLKLTMVISAIFPLLGIVDLFILKAINKETK